MIKTQIQLPDELYRAAKEVAARNECSLAEVVRRGLEYVVSVYPGLRVPREEWKLPGPFNLGLKKDFFSDPDWRDEVNLSSSALNMVREKRKPGYGRKKRQ